MTTIRIFFEKCGEAAYISLLDLQRVFHRMLKMSSLPVYYTQGFNPHIYLSFTCPLSDWTAGGAKRHRKTHGKAVKRDENRK